MNEKPFHFIYTHKSLYTKLNGSTNYSKTFFTNILVFQLYTLSYLIINVLWHSISFLIQNNLSNLPAVIF